MKKFKNKSIVFGLKTLSILAFGLLIIPVSTYAEGGRNIVYSNTDAVFSPSPTVTRNPVPAVDSLDPSSANKSLNSRTITVNGSGFVPSSVARVNGSNRSTTFIDSEHLLVQLQSGDLYQANGFYVTVFNPAPGGGYSNAVFFTLNGTVPAASNQNNNSFDYGNQPSGSVEGASDNGSSLASAAILGTGSFLPSGFIQWILLAIMVLIIIILVRRIFGARKRYDEAPLKHA